MAWTKAVAKTLVKRDKIEWVILDLLCGLKDKNEISLNLYSHIKTRVDGLLNEWQILDTELSKISYEHKLDKDPEYLLDRDKSKDLVFNMCDELDIISKKIKPENMGNVVQGGGGSLALNSFWNSY